MFITIDARALPDWYQRSPRILQNFRDAIVALSCRIMALRFSFYVGLSVLQADTDKLWASSPFTVAVLALMKVASYLTPVR